VDSKLRSLRSAGPSTKPEQFQGDRQSPKTRNGSHSRAEPEVRIHSAPAESPQTIGSSAVASERKLVDFVPELIASERFSTPSATWALGRSPEISVIRWAMMRCWQQPGAELRSCNAASPPRRPALEAGMPAHCQLSGLSAPFPAPLCLSGAARLGGQRTFRPEPQRHRHKEHTTGG